MSNMGSSGVANYALTSIGQAVRAMAVVGVGGNDVNVEGPSLALDFMPVFGTTNPQLDPRITFSRASNATVVGSNGLIQYAPHNLLTFSEQFDNAAWLKAGCATSANTTTAPDGSITADTLTEDSSSGVHKAYRNLSATAGVTFTLSVYAKISSGSRNLMLKIWDGSSIDKGNSFNLVNGTIGSLTGYSQADSQSINNLGNGWYRCTITVKAGSSATGDISIGILSGTADTYVGNGTSGFFIWGAQLEVGSTATTYNPTTVKNLLGFSEAFDNAGWTKSNSFIQTNLLTFSQEFSNAAWSKDANRGSFATTSVSPVGDVTAQTLTAGTGGFGYVYRTITTVASTSYAFSFYAKSGTSNFAYFEMSGKTPSYVNLTTLATAPVSGVTVTATSVGNGWIRIVGVASATTTSHSFSIGGSDASGSQAMASGNTIILWGAQLVQGSVAGDYQQTTSAALAVQYQDPNGTMTADKLVENTASAEHRVQVSQTLSTASITASVYFKASERSLAFIRLDDVASTKYAYFNLATGVVGTVTAGLTASITSVGNGWYRCSALFSAPASGSGSVAFAPTTGNGTSSYAGDGTSGIFIWGAQLSDSASLDQYVNNPVAAPSSTAFYGARFDYNPSTLQPLGLLIEEQRSNLILFSEDFSNAGWTKNNVTVTANSMVAPDGTLTADTILATTSTFTLLSRAVSSAGSASGNTMSAYVKQGNGATVGNVFILRNSTTSTNLAIATFDYSTGVVTQGTGSGAYAQNVGNGWYRIVIPAASGISAGDSLIAYYGFPGNAQTAGDSFNIWGAQLEAGAFATSYIPTTTAQVTRSADVAVVQGSNFSSWYNVNEGTIAATAFTTVPNTDIVVRFVAAVYDAPGYTNAIRLERTQGLYRDVQTVGGAANVATATWNANNLGKLAGAYRVNDSSTSFNGGTPIAIAGAVPVGVVALGIGGVIGSNAWCGYIRQIAYYPRRLQNSELQAITS